VETQQFYRPLLCEISWCLLPLRVTPVRLVRFDSKRVPECHFDRERPRDLFNIEMRVAILVTLMNDPWCGIPRASTFQSAPRSQSSSELWQVTRNGYCILFYFLHSDIKVKCEVFAHVIAPRRIHQIFIIRKTFSFKIYIYIYTWIFVLPSVCGADKRSPFWRTFVLFPLGVIYVIFMCGLLLW